MLFRLAFEAGVFGKKGARAVPRSFSRVEKKRNELICVLTQVQIAGAEKHVERARGPSGFQPLEASEMATAIPPSKSTCRIMQQTS